MELILRFLGPLITFVLIIFALVYFFQARIIFFPQRLSADHEFSFSQSFREGFLELRNGKKINYLTFEATRPRGNILFFQGNAGSLNDWGHLAAELSNEQAWNVWIADYPGYGKSDGPLPKDEREMLELSLALRQLLSEEELPVVAYGRSLGSALATHLAKNNKVDALVLETPYRSISKLGRDLYPFLPEALSRYDLNNEKALPKLGALPVLILHGTRDEVVPFAHGKHLAASGKNVSFVPIKGGRHNDLPSYPEHRQALTSFLEKIKKADGGH